MIARFPLLVWHDQFKTALLAQAAIPPRRDLVAADTTPITNDNTDPARRDAKVTSVNSTSAIATQAVADKNTRPSRRAGTNKHARALAARIKAHPAYTGALGSLLGIEGPQDTTDLTTSKPTLAGVDPARRDGVVELDFDKSISDGVNLYANPEGFRGDFVFLARDTASPYVDNRPLLAVGKPELREYKAVYVQSDAEIGLFSDEVVVNCAP
jgi:hypothetical protein